ncbi:flagellar hook assembly protein FlgD [Rhodobacteraceae bacterium KMM 6894]|nr:flagellar hook assembly protein FlgD [Rhodobacteraceae bacterium KMM 6894]
MDITATQQSSAFGATASETAAQSDSGTKLASDFETFLKMLTAQMKNQDPLNPVDSSEFSSQLAAFSSVEQQVRTNDLLTGMGDQLGVLGMGQLQGWVGMTARAEMPVTFTGQPVPLNLTTQPGADLAQLVVRDVRGGIVHQQTVPAQGGVVEWVGTDETGQRVANGTYTLSVDSFQGEDLLGSNPVVTQDRIVEARLSDGQTVLVMAGGQQVAASQVIGLRNPDE